MSNDERERRRARIRELAQRTEEQARALAALRAQLGEIVTGAAPAPPARDSDPDILRIRAALERSHAELGAIRADIESTAATREATMPVDKPKPPAK